MPKESLIEEIVAGAERFSALRRDIHAHPELGFEVTRTADLVASRLREWGCQVETGIGRTGVVAQLKNGSGERWPRKFGQSDKWNARGLSRR